MMALKKKWKHNVNVQVLLVKMWKRMKVQGGVLGDFKEESKFIGYDQLQAESKVVGIVNDDAISRLKLNEGQEAQLILDDTPFYAESGGQIADKGTLKAAGEASLM